VTQHFRAPILALHQGTRRNLMVQLWSCFFFEGRRSRSFEPCETPAFTTLYGMKISFHSCRYSPQTYIEKFRRPPRVLIYVRKGEGGMIPDRHTLWGPSSVLQPLWIAQLIFLWSFSYPSRFRTDQLGSEIVGDFPRSVKFS
jgi:hypothetical protein